MRASSIYGASECVSVDCGVSFHCCLMYVPEDLTIVKHCSNVSQDDIKHFFTAPCLMVLSQIY